MIIKNEEGRTDIFEALMTRAKRVSTIEEARDVMVEILEEYKYFHSKMWSIMNYVTGDARMLKNQVDMLDIKITNDKYENERFKESLRCKPTCSCEGDKK